VKKIYLALAVILVLLQVRLLSSEGGLVELFALQDQLESMEASLEEQRLINAKLAEEVKNLQSNPLAVETIARQTLGMVKKDEVFIKVIELKPEDSELEVNPFKNELN
jgi:cell division protein FtsB